MEDHHKMWIYIILLLAALAVIFWLCVKYAHSSQGYQINHFRLGNKNESFCPAKIPGYNRRIIKVNKENNVNEENETDLNKEKFITQINRKSLQKQRDNDIQAWTSTDFCGPYMYATDASPTCSIDYKYKCQRNLLKNPEFFFVFL